jgi:ubiquinone/menaquinone biosynthesis C-methylase UbiE
MIETPLAPPPDSDFAQVRLLQQEFARAKDYAAEYRGDTPIAHFFNTRLRRVGELLGDFAAGRVLDLGCGPAAIGERFRGRAIEYHGADVSEEMIRECTARFGDDPRFSFSLARLEQLPFRDHFFDAVLCLGVLEYVPDGEAAVREIVRVVKPGGAVVISMLNPLSPYRLWLRYGRGKLCNAANRLRRLGRGTTSGPGGGARMRPFSREYTERALRRLVASGGLVIEDIVYYDFNVLPAPLDTRWSRASVRLSRRLECLGRSGLRRLGTGFILKARPC